MKEKERYEKLIQLEDELEELLNKINVLKELKKIIRKQIILYSNFFFHPIQYVKSMSFISFLKRKNISRKFEIKKFM
ncbi:MAG: hypothetical protein ACTSWY_08770 [Promethearchaeota archaeon]